MFNFLQDFIGEEAFLVRYQSTLTSFEALTSLKYISSRIYSIYLLNIN